MGGADTGGGDHGSDDVADADLRGVDGDPCVRVGHPLRPREYCYQTREVDLYNFKIYLLS